MTAQDFTIRPATAADAAALAAIYNHYVANSCATFEVEPLDPDEMRQRIEETNAASLPWLVAAGPRKILGYAYASAWRKRHAYRFSVESTIYLDADETRNGVGIRLYTALVDALSSTTAHAVIGGIALPNDASVRLHERLGFTKIGHFEQVGYKMGRWVDVGYWQLIL